MPEDDESGSWTRRGFLTAAALGASGYAASALTNDGADGNLYGGNMALDQAYNVAGDLWIGPDSAKSNVDAKSGRIFLASDADVEYYGDGGSWELRSVGSSQQPVPEVHTERAGIKSGLSRPKETYQNRLVGRRQATVCIIYDDGKIEDKTEFLPIHEQYDAPFGSALISDSLGDDGFLAEDDIHDLVTSDVSWEAISHGRKSLRLLKAENTSSLSAGTTTIEVDLSNQFREGYEYRIIAPDTEERFVVTSIDGTTLTLASGLENSYQSGREIVPTKRSIEVDLGGCKQDLQELGLTVNGHVFSGNATYGPIGQQIASQYFGWARSDMSSGSNYVGGRNNVPLNRFALNGAIIGQLVGSGLGARLDAIESNNELGVFYGHGGSETAGEIETLISEIRTRDIDILTPTEAVARFTTDIDTPTPANRVAEADRSLYLPFLKSSGSTVYDASGRNNDGAFVKNPNRIETHLGRGASIRQIDGNKIQIPHDPSLNPGAGSWTFVAWLRTTGNPGRIIDKGDFNVGVVGGFTSLRFFLDDGSTWETIDVPITYNRSGDLFQVAAVRDAENDEMRVYANSTHDRAGNTKTAPSGDINPTDDLYIGGDDTSTFSQDVFSPQIYSRALSREELLTMHLTTVGSQAVEGDLRTVDAGNGLVVTTPDGANRYRIRVDNTGAVTTEQL